MLTALLLSTLPLLTLSTPTTRPTPFKKLTPYPGRVTIFNSCPQTFNLWSIPGTSPTTPMTLPPAHVYIEEPRTPPTGGGISLKLTSSTSLSLTAPHTQLEYTLVNDTLWYDISFIDCVAKNPATGEMSDGRNCPGHGDGVQAVGGGSCGVLASEGGAFCEDVAYFLPEGGYKDVSPVERCAVGEGVAFELCAGLRERDL